MSHLWESSKPRPWRPVIQATVISLSSLALVMFFVTRAATPVRFAAVVEAASPSSRSQAAQATFVLYDGALHTGTPDTQGFYYLTYPPSTSAATQSFTNSITTLDTLSRTSDYAGYFANSTLYPALDRHRGYQIILTTQVISELHTNNDRAGFSLLVLSHDKLGIELGFWTNEIWAQEGGTSHIFTHAEGAAFNTATDLITYRLVVLDSTYNLSANGSTVLTGSLRNYTAATITFPFNPYAIPDLIFLGDDTSSAQGKIRLSAVSIIDEPPYSIHLPLVMKN